MATVAIKKHNYGKTIRMYVMLIVVCALLAGYYGYTAYQKLSASQDALASEQSQITALQNTEAQSSADYTTLKQSFDQKYAGVLDQLQAVYPPTEDYTNLTRELDAFFQNANKNSFNPVFLSDLKYGEARYDAKADYAVLPVTMTITGTQDNFTKFLQYIQNSGGLTDKTRLMDIRSISINFTTPAPAQTTPGGQTTGAAASATPQTMLNVSVSLNAYFQKPFALTSTASAAAGTPAATPAS
jgi:hypothetical protein